MANIDVLLEGYKRFYSAHFDHDKKLYKDLATKGQMPKTLVIGCSDSRVDPSILFDADPGDMFVIRNVANLVPPYEQQESYHGTSAALEFAVTNLEVEHIVVMGHSGCAGIKCLMDNNIKRQKEFSFISSWVNIAKDAKDRALAKCLTTSDEKYSVCEKESIITSMQNLLSFPWISEKTDDGSLEIHGWYFSLADGKLHVLSEQGVFEEV